MSNTQLPVHVVCEIKSKAIDYSSSLVFDNPRLSSEGIEGRRTEASIDYQAGATEYAIKLLQCDKANSDLEEKNRGLVENNAAARALLEKVVTRHEAGLLPDRFIYEEIKTFLDGTK